MNPAEKQELLREHGKMVTYWKRKAEHNEQLVKDLRARNKKLGVMLLAAEGFVTGFARSKNVPKELKKKAQDWLKGLEGKEALELFGATHTARKYLERALNQLHIVSTGGKADETELDVLLCRD